MEIEYTLSEEEFVAANKLHSRQKFSSVITISVCMIILICITFLLNVFLAKIIAVVAAISMIIMHIVIRNIYVPYAMKKQYRSYRSIREPVTISLADDGVLWHSFTGENITPWKLIVKWREDQSFILIYLSPMHYYVIPKRIGELSISISKALEGNIGNAT